MSFKKLLRFFLAAIIFLPAFALAQTVTPPTNLPTQVAQPLANLNLTNAAILSQDNQNIKIGFDLENSSVTPQPDIKYGVQLIQTTKEGQNIVDSYVASEVLAIPGSQTAHKEITYNLPTFLTGTYDLWVMAKTTGGLILGLANPGKVTLSGTTDQISLSNCKLSVANQDYTLTQGVDLKKEEDLTLKCQGENLADKQLTVIPTFNTYLRSTYGSLVSLSYPDPASLTFAPKEKKDLSINLPKANNPQAYDVVIFLKTQDDAPVSEKITVHYVLQGASATIQNVSLDKANYAKDDIAVVALFWTPSADGFLDSRAGQGSTLSTVNAILSIVDSKGQACIAPLVQELSQEKNSFTLNAPIISNCDKSAATIKLTDKDGNILDQRNFPGLTNSKQIEITNTINSSSKIKESLLILLAVFLLGLMFWKINANRKNKLGIFLFGLIVFGSLFGGRGAKAVTWNNNSVSGTYLSADTIYYADKSAKLRAAGYGGSPEGGSDWGWQDVKNVFASLGFTSVSHCAQFCGTNSTLELSSYPAAAYRASYYFTPAFAQSYSSYTVNSNKATYNSGETITLSASASISGCGNSHYMAVFANNAVDLMPYANKASSSMSGSGTLTAPTVSSPTSYTITLQAAVALDNKWNLYGETWGGTSSITVTVNPIDNGCASWTYNNAQCWNGSRYVWGTVTPPPVNNGCAANTCNTNQCYNNISWVWGTKVCADNSCAANTCTFNTCWNNLTWISGTKACDNGCAANTCVGQTCNNSITTVQGTKACDNGCAANTCTTATCNNSITTVQGTKACDNGCAALTCTTTQCWNNLAWVTGTQICADNSCAAATCSKDVCWNNLVWIPGTKSPTYSCAESDAHINAFCANASNCGLSVTTNSADLSCTALHTCSPGNNVTELVDISVCIANSIPCPSTPKTITCPGCALKIKQGGFKEVAP